LWQPRPRWAVFHIVAVIAGGLALDKAFGWPGQIAADLWAAAVFGWLYAQGGPAERRVLVACMLIAGLGECVLSLVWGLYAYQFGNIPLFVPPGHALLMTLGIMVAARLPVCVVWAVPLAAGPWALAGWWQGWDQAGSLLFVLLAVCMAASSGRRLYAAMFVLALAMELYGTWLGNWAWKPVVAGLGLSTTNPPAHAGAFYCALDLLVLASLRLPRTSSARNWRLGRATR
ncbi:MAG TPA: hypothetical protein VMB75_10990, partial [Rhodocyclaceae bacterium]|nr:hypothetical protein [Rhodocyclaceae bacterium]